MRYCEICGKKKCPLDVCNVGSKKCIQSRCNAYTAYHWFKIRFEICGDCLEKYRVFAGRPVRELPIELKKALMVARLRGKT